MIIAELCQNHNGDFNILRKMVSQSQEQAQHILKFKIFMQII